MDWMTAEVPLHSFICLSNLLNLPYTSSNGRVNIESLMLSICVLMSYYDSEWCFHPVSCTEGSH